MDSQISYTGNARSVSEELQTNIIRYIANESPSATEANKHPRYATSFLFLVPPSLVSCPRSIP